MSSAVQELQPDLQGLFSLAHPWHHPPQEVHLYQECQTFPLDLVVPVVQELLWVQGSLCLLFCPQCQLVPEFPEFLDYRHVLVSHLSQEFLSFLEQKSLKNYIFEKTLH